MNNAERERVAREFVLAHKPFPGNHIVEDLVTLLASREAAVLEEAASLCDIMSASTPHNIAVSLRYIAKERLA